MPTPTLRCTLLASPFVTSVSRPAPMLTTLFAATILLLIVALVALIRVSRDRTEARARSHATEVTLNSERVAASAWSARLEATIHALEERVERLSKWESAADADDTAAALLRDARQAAQAVRADAERQVQDARVAAAAIQEQAAAESTAVVAGARKQAARLGDQSKAALAAAYETAGAIVREASRKAEELAGSALRAVQQADEYERTVQALQNKIEGYGDRYLIPSHSLLDDLADDMGQAEAGQRLKTVRSEIRDRVRTGAAATCDYVEPNRRDTAIRFVVDAFNGKADSILARIRSDNMGTLTQELRDAFTLVNHNGQAFRNARIRDGYLALRLDELRWAAIATELKVQEREEQRRIQEQIREEEKARRDYERAMRDAAKEEELVRKAMAKAEAAMAKATEEQKAQYEQQLVELSEKLKEAEARNQRALSMAQQTRRGHVYIISNVGSFGDSVYKIGLTRRLDPLDRVRELGDSSVPFEFDVHAMIFAEDAPALEAQLHRHFVLAQVNKVNHRKEFFRTDLVHVRQEIESLGLLAKWTMAAAAREFRESAAIERTIAEDPIKREAWLRRQLALEPPLADEDDSPSPPSILMTPAGETAVQSAPESETEDDLSVADSPGSIAGTSPRALVV